MIFYQVMTDVQSGLPNLSGCTVKDLKNPTKLKASRSEKETGTDFEENEIAEVTSI